MKCSNRLVFERNLLKAFRFASKAFQKLQVIKAKETALESEPFFADSFKSFHVSTE